MKSLGELVVLYAVVLDGNSKLCIVKVKFKVSVSLWVNKKVGSNLSEGSIKNPFNNSLAFTFSFADWHIFI